MKQLSFIRLLFDSMPIITINAPLDQEITISIFSLVIIIEPLISELEWILLL